MSRTTGTGQNRLAGKRHEANCKVCAHCEREQIEAECKAGGFSVRLSPVPCGRPQPSEEPEAIRDSPHHGDSKTAMGPILGRM